MGLLLALAGVAVLGGLWLWSASSAGEGGEATAAAPSAAAGAKPGWLSDLPGMSSGPAQEPAHAPEGDADPTRDLKSYIPRGANPSMPEVIERLHERGIFSGLGAFSPPGTRPPLVGLAVPEDFDLPKGYVRHHQVTDDGQTIEAILMFAPDFQLYDANNQPVAMPKDRVVPPELAPPGLPQRRITIPAPREPARPGQ
ncbi:hypothetical protein H3H37_07885 [Duganella sp. LX20W]|uniref:Uncharacterized protein n=1 Tax=Rugamonas brunnea TaxID=2758569 RepID=A0A7W2IBI0_9BURK|nr:hypothetical protein [Rugamonas brunnea]